MPPPLHARALAAVLSGLVACDVPALVELAPDAARDAAADVAPAPPATPSCPDPAEHGCARVRVTGGAFTQGADDLPEASPPLRDLRVSDFTLDGYEVTVARARRFRDDLPRWLASLPARDALEVRYPNGATLRVSLVGLAGATLQNPAEGVGINRLDDPVRPSCGTRSTACRGTSRRPSARGTAVACPPRPSGSTPPAGGGARRRRGGRSRGATRRPWGAATSPTG
jgi:hypothetical protein